MGVYPRRGSAALRFSRSCSRCSFASSSRRSRSSSSLSSSRYSSFYSWMKVLWSEWARRLPISKLPKPSLTTNFLRQASWEQRPKRLSPWTRRPSLNMSRKSSLTTRESLKSTKVLLTISSSTFSPLRSARWLRCTRCFWISWTATLFMKRKMLPSRTKKYSFSRFSSTDSSRSPCLSVTWAAVRGAQRRSRLCLSALSLSSLISFLIFSRSLSMPRSLAFCIMNSCCSGALQSISGSASMPSG
mmetsp:Transcript_19207/g.32730  ORF Transcript_19207/g.32730 Transcript_19207/m.32730 type:complete len:244 (-) Transcript_19207:4-735(-)